MNNDSIGLVLIVRISLATQAFAAVYQVSVIIKPGVVYTKTQKVKKKKDLSSTSDISLLLEQDILNHQIRIQTAPKAKPLSCRHRNYSLPSNVDDYLYMYDESNLVEKSQE